MASVKDFQAIYEEFRSEHDAWPALIKTVEAISDSYGYFTLSDLQVFLQYETEWRENDERER